MLDGLDYLELDAAILEGLLGNAKASLPCFETGLLDSIGLEEAVQMLTLTPLAL